MIDYKLIVSCGENSIDLYNDKAIMCCIVGGVGKEANVNTADYSGMAGGVYNSSHEPVRHITISAKFMPGELSCEKERIYNVFMLGKELTITYVTPYAEDLTIKGYCQKCDIPPNEYPLVMSAEIVCPDPYFRQRFTQPIQLFGVSKLFCFKKEGITLNRICFGNSEKSKLVRLEYKGAADAGVVFKIALSDSCGGFRIDNFTVGKHIELIGDFLAGDIIEISTEDGRKYARLVRGGQELNALKYVSADSVFWALTVGVNNIKFSADGLAVTSADVMMYYGVKVGAV